MRIKQLILKDFGPFNRYKISFVEEDEICMLLTGKNNEGKSSIINGLKLLNDATKVINKKKQEIKIDGDYYYKLLQQDTENFLVGRMIHNYKENRAEIIGIFQGGLEITVYLDPIENMIFANFEGCIPVDVHNIFGFIPPLGPLNENEDIITKLSYLKASIDTSLAPRHLRNHFYQILTKDELALVRQLIKRSWVGIELLDYELNYQQGKIYCYYKEGGIGREISWAGQGLQVWFQIITHVVRLRESSILILDEPEINLHPEKQNDIIRILKDYYHGSIIIATHSIELMNNVSVSHIINVQKKHNKPKIKSTKDRVYLNLVRSQIGSNFNLIASQFEEFDIIVFTEDTFDFDILQQIALDYKIRKKAFNIPIYGFSEFNKCISYKHAYKTLIGKDIDYTLVLDRDYYPEEYLKKVTEILKTSSIKVVFTPGKEIENLFLSPDILTALIPETSHKKFSKIWDEMFESLRLDCYGSYLTLHGQFLDPKLDTKTIATRYTPVFEKCWSDTKNRHKIVSGKEALKVLRKFYRDETKSNLSQNLLIEKLIQIENENIKQFIEEVYQLRKTRGRS
ncbi:MAG: AAA family ATPase [bacterium]|nr:AAA family ATPase [bacterium]